MGAQAVVGLAVQASMFLVIMAVAMQTDAKAVSQHMRDPALLLKGVIAVNVVPPLVAVLLVLAMALERPVAQGLLLMAISPLAPLIPGNAYKAGAERARIVALYASLIALAVVIVPISVLVLNAIFGAHAVAPPRKIGEVILLSAIVPILVGLALGGIWPRFSRRAAPIVTLLSYIVLGVVVVLLLAVAGRQFLAMLGNGTLLSFGATVLAGLVAGHLLGGPDRGGRIALAFAASVRHPGIAATIAHASGASSQAVLATVLFLLNGVVLTSLYQVWLKRTAPTAQAVKGAPASSSTEAG